MQDVALCTRHTSSGHQIKKARRLFFDHLQPLCGCVGRSQEDQVHVEFGAGLLERSCLFGGQIGHNHTSDATAGTVTGKAVQAAGVNHVVVAHEDLGYGDVCLGGLLEIDIRVHPGGDGPLCCRLDGRAVRNGIRVRQPQLNDIRPGGDQSPHQVGRCRRRRVPGADVNNEQGRSSKCFRDFHIPSPLPDPCHRDRRC